MVGRSVYGYALSAGRRFLKTFGFALIQAALFGTLIGALGYFRLPATTRLKPSDELRWHERLRGWLERVELWSYDWRAAELGRRSVKSDAVVLVPIDEEALVNARQDDRPGMAIQPWPREIIGALVDRLQEEGASTVVLQLPFIDQSPTTVPVFGPRDESSSSDDAALGAMLERRAGRSVLGFYWSESRGPPVAGQTRPYLLRVGDRRSPSEWQEGVRRILADHRPAFVVPAGPVFQIWAGASSEDDAGALARRWGLAGTPEVRERVPADRRYQVSALDLMVSLSEVEVEGLDPSALPRVQSVNHPVPELLSGSVALGGMTQRADPDGKVRGMWHLVNYTTPDGKEHLLPSAALATAMQRAGTRDLTYSKGRLYVGDRYSIPMDRSGYTWISWDAPEAARDGRGSLKRSVSSWRVLVNLFDRRQGAPPHYRNDLDNRVAVLANTSSYSIDFWNTPIGKVSGGGLTGQAALNLLRSEGVSRADPRWDLILTSGLALLGALLALSLGAGFRSALGVLTYLALGVGAAGLYLWIARYVFVTERAWFPTAGPLLAMAAAFASTNLYALRVEQSVLDWLRSALGQSLSPELAREVTQNVSLMRPERREVTVYFSDIEGFTRLSEGLEPSTLVELLNAYLSEMTRAVGRNGGQVDKYIGDTVSAFWGAPLRNPRHAQLACEAALNMRELLARRQGEWEKRFGRKLEFRAGLATGEAVVGDMGTELKSNYTVLGEVVGLASRLERENRYYGTYVLVSERTAQAAGDRFHFREVDRIRTPTGGAAPIFELVGRRSRFSAQPAGLVLYGQALKAYRARKFLEALDLFNRCSEEHRDSVAALYVRRCDHYLDAPPPENWDGVFEGAG